MAVGPVNTRALGTVNTRQQKSSDGHWVPVAITNQQTPIGIDRHWEAPGQQASAGTTGQRVPSGTTGHHTSPGITRQWVSLPGTRHGALGTINTGQRAVEDTKQWWSLAVSGHW